MHPAKSVVTSCIGLTLLSLSDSSSAVGGLLHMPIEMGSVSTGTTDFIVRVDMKLWVGFGLFENCIFLFGTEQGHGFWQRMF